MRPSSSQWLNPAKSSPNTYLLVILVVSWVVKPCINFEFYEEDNINEMSCTQNCCLLVVFYLLPSVTRQQDIQHNNHSHTIIPPKILCSWWWILVNVNYIPNWRNVVVKHKLDLCDYEEDYINDSHVCCLLVVFEFFTFTLLSQGKSNY